MRRVMSYVLCAFILFTPLCTVHADYVLPYPSFMPGNKFYKISKIIETFEKWWYWGSIGQTKYNMQLADKYLVEAKTLFEYKQYFLALKALRQSDAYISKVPLFINQARNEKKDAKGLELV